MVTSFKFGSLATFHFGIADRNFVVTTLELRFWRLCCRIGLLLCWRGGRWLSGRLSQVLRSCFLAPSRLGCFCCYLGAFAGTEFSGTRFTALESTQAAQTDSSRVFR